MAMAYVTTTSVAVIPSVFICIAVIAILQRIKSQTSSFLFMIILSVVNGNFLKILDRLNWSVSHSWHTSWHLHHLHWHSRWHLPSRWSSSHHRLVLTWSGSWHHVNYRHMTWHLTWNMLHIS